MNAAATPAHLEVPTTILAQLGGRRFMMMTGAVVMGDANSLKVFFKGSTKTNRLNVTLEADDTYTLEFHRVRGTNVRSVETMSGVYAEDLQRIFTEVTGLYTSL